MEFGKTQGELMLEHAVREAQWAIIRRRVYLALAIVAVAALVWIAIK